MICLLNAIGLTTGSSSTVHIYTQTVHRKTQKFWKSAGRAPSLRFYPDICLTTEEKARKNLSQGSRRVPVHHGFGKSLYVYTRMFNMKLGTSCY